MEVGTRLLETGGRVPRIVADGILGTEIVGPDLWIYLFRWREVNGVLGKVLVGIVERPLASFTPEQLLFLGEGWLNIPGRVLH